MYGNYLNGPMMMPNMSYPMMRMGMQGASRGPLGGLRSLLGLGSRGISGNFVKPSGINFSTILNNTSKTIGVVKEAIPIVKEVKPMMNNMRSMLKLASAFKDETDVTPILNKSAESTANTDDTSRNIEANSTSNTPNFFL